MITESRIKAIEQRLDELTQNFLQTQINQVPITAKTDETSNKVDYLDKKVDEAVESIYPEWNPNSYEYFAGEKVTYNGEYYRCIQSHKSQSDWTPDTAVSLWVRTSNPQEEWPEWKQPTGAHDAYAKGAKVTHLFRHWTSDVDNNTWEPGVYGWTEA